LKVVQRDSPGWHGLEELRPIVRAYLSRFGAVRADLEDIVQETLLRAARYRSTLQDPERLRPWVLRIAQNVVRDHRRQEARLPRAELDDGAFDELQGREEAPGDLPDEGWIMLCGVACDREGMLAHLHGALAEMQSDDRRVLGHYYAFDQASHAAVSVCELSSRRIKLRAFRARRRLSKLLYVRLGDEALPRELIRRGLTLPNKRGARCAPSRGDGGRRSAREDVR
jgi:DNA-directed RNA polymerase specialized sigma24 family protein